MTKKSKVAYLCDGYACGYPQPDGCQAVCKHTTKVEHAALFELAGDGSGYWMELDDEGKREKKERLERARGATC